jgi:phosphoenolpyruvate carboxykinase (ATP)
MPIAYTRAMLDAALGGALDEAPMRVDPVFGVSVPVACAGVPADVLDPRATWSDVSAYDEQAQRLAAMFRDNFAQFASDVSADVQAAGPVVR